MKTVWLWLPLLLMLIFCKHSKNYKSKKINGFLFTRFAHHI